MTEPHWLDKTECLAIHHMLLSQFGGLAGVRDEGLLESALQQPQQSFHYEKPSLFELAAGYAFGIVKNHPFLDGNKRTGFILAALFIEKNGYRFAATEEQAVLETLALAAGETDRAHYAAWLQHFSEPA